MSAPTSCHACEGRGRVPCAWCGMDCDDLRTECFRCLGSGNVECDDCDGTGVKESER